MPPRRNGVTGPTSAMSAYLKEQGIVGRTGINYNPGPAAPPPAPAAPPANAEAGPSNPTNAVAGPASSRRPTNLIDLDEEDEAEESDQASPQKDAGGTKRKKKMVVIDDSDDLDGSDEDYSRKDNFKKTKKEEDSDDSDTFAPPPPKKIAPAPPPATKKKAVGRPANGSISKCGECGGKVTVTNYSPPSPDDPSSVLCRPCAVKAGLGDYKGPAAAAKKAAVAAKKTPAAQRRKIVHYEEKARILTLKDITIEVIAKNVEDIETLGSIGSANMEKVNDIICKHRKMTSQTAQLFYDVELTSFTMKDCTNIDPPGFLVLSNLCPNLTSLTLNLCGQLTDEPLVHFSTQLPSLTRLELLGPFLVRKQAWINFFTHMGSRLEGFLVRQSPRIDLECIEALVENCGKGLRELRLSECGKMEGSWLSVLANGGLKKLQHLDLSYSLNPLPSGCSELEELIVAVGPNLLSLNLAGQSLLTSQDLFTLLPTNLPVLTKLDLTLLSLLTEPSDDAPVKVEERGLLDEEEDENIVPAVPVVAGAGMDEVFNAWAEHGNVGLESVKMGKAHLLKGATLNALVGLAGGTLKELEITGWKDVEEEVVKGLGKRCKWVKRLDVGWCRNVTDFTLKEIFEDAVHLQEVVVWGCNLITINHPRKKGVKIIGVESHQF